MKVVFKTIRRSYNLSDQSDATEWRRLLLTACNLSDEIVSTIIDSRAAIAELSSLLIMRDIRGLGLAQQQLAINTSLRWTTRQPVCRDLTQLGCHRGVQTCCCLLD